MGITQLGDIPDKSTVLQELITLIRDNQNAITDPMSIGCRGDLREDLAPIKRRKIGEASSVGATEQEITKAIANGLALASDDYKNTFGKWSGR